MSIPFLLQAGNPLSQGAADLFKYSPSEMALNVGLATVLGIIVALVYRATHKGLSYSQSFTQTIFLVSIIVAIVMMVIGGSLSRAFALVGALSIIRFRTVVKDTRDTAFVFAALAVGMAAGTSSYVLAGLEDDRGLARRLDDAQDELRGSLQERVRPALLLRSVE